MSKDGIWVYGYKICMDHRSKQLTKTKLKELPLAGQLLR